MPIAQTDTAPARSSRPPAARIIEFKNTLQRKSGAAAEWARDRADAAHGAAERRPLTVAAISATAAFAGGVALALLLSNRANAKRRRTPRSLPHAFTTPFAERARTLLRM